MIQIRKEDNQKKQKEKKLKIYKVNTHKKTVIALWVLLAVSFLFAVYKNFTAIDIHTVHETKVIEETILDTHKIENFVENFAEVYYSWEQSAASIDNRTNALKGYSHRRTASPECRYCPKRHPRIVCPDRFSDMGNHRRKGAALSSDLYGGTAYHSGRIQ